VLVALNSVSRSSPSRAGLFYLSVLPAWLGLPQTIWPSPAGPSPARADLPRHPAAGRLLSRRLVNVLAPELVREQVSARIGPFALYGLLFTIMVLFALQAADHSHPLTWLGSPCHCWCTSRSCVRSFALAGRWAFPTSARRRWRSRRWQQLRARHRGAIATFAHQRPSPGWGGRPLIEVPVLVALVYAALWHAASSPPRTREPLCPTCPRCERDPPTGRLAVRPRLRDRAARGRVPSDRTGPARCAIAWSQATADLDAALRIISNSTSGRSDTTAPLFSVVKKRRARGPRRQRDQHRHLDERADHPSQGLAAGDAERRDGHRDGELEVVASAVNASVVVRS